MSSADQRRPQLRGDEADLFREFNPSLVRFLLRRSDAPRELIDDASAFAWQQFVEHQPDRDRNWRGWLMTTAERELWRQYGFETRHLSLNADDATGRLNWDVPDERDHVAIRLRLREALRAFARLPDSRREIKALQVTGFSYDEIAEMRGLTWTRVNHLLGDANKALREEQGRVAAERFQGSPRAARLDELEREPPEWLKRAIGRRPPVTEHRPALLAWRRAALTLDDYRCQYGRGLGDEPLGKRPIAADAARAFDLARAAIERAVQARSRHRSRPGLER